uniref:NADH dehydrogenase subunit 6 n=1 Tax=Terebellides stroemii TaxID=1037239 RepID=B3TJX0_9ANNE|nr:NADH dehydrogenase subunit 6 [Terebellides stroemii]ABW76476.1 NADH dehydrogenase subunit 6 [Terebellides stroemii]
MTLILTITLTLSMALTLPLAHTPLTLGAWVLMLAILLSMTTAMTTSTWFGLILFIIYISGMLVMFSYFAAISPNQHLPISNLLYSLLTILILSITYLSSKSILPSSTSFSKITYSNPNLMSMYSNYQVPILMLLAILLLLILILVVKIVEHKKGPLRPFS